MNKIYAKVVTLFLIIGGAFGVGILIAKHQNRPDHVVHAVPPGNKVAPKEFLEDYDAFNKEKDAILKIQKEYNLQYRYDAMKAWSNRLSSEVPQGYSFDEVTRSFALLPPPPPQPVHDAPAVPQVRK